MADMTEREALAILLDSLGNARDAMRSLALLRSDEGWVTASKIIDRVRDNAIQLAHKSVAERLRH